MNPSAMQIKTGLNRGWAATGAARAVKWNVSNAKSNSCCVCVGFFLLLLTFHVFKLDNQCHPAWQGLTTTIYLITMCNRSASRCTLGKTPTRIQKLVEKTKQTTNVVKTKLNPKTTAVFDGNTATVLQSVSFQTLSHT